MQQNVALNMQRNTRAYASYVFFHSHKAFLFLQTIKNTCVTFCQRMPSHTNTSLHILVSLVFYIMQPHRKTNENIMKSNTQQVLVALFKSQLGVC